jgi:hypothetical protein
MADAVKFHLYDFGSGGYYQAASKEQAFEIYDQEIDDGAAAEDFAREVPDDEELEVYAEVGDKWDDPREYSKPIKPQQGYRGMIEVVWCLKLTAREWANEQGHREAGYAFGGDF